MELLAARIGTTINYCKPYTPTAKDSYSYYTHFEL